jgi:gamma-glutamylcyclotransferase (GGCT)/AIG2-like uncharacterized protein YtfP
MNNPGVYHLFVYGSLRSGFQSTAYEYISRYFVLTGNAKVKGTLYDLGSFPAAKPGNEDSFIIGELYQLKQDNEFGWAFGQLDDYEGVNVAYDEVQMYYRAITDVYFDDQVIPAWIYWYKGDIMGKPLIESGDVLFYMDQKK